MADSYGQLRIGFGGEPQHVATFLMSEQVWLATASVPPNDQSAGQIIRAGSGLGQRAF